MTAYEATVSADFSGYTDSVQQSIALTKQFAAANEGMVGFIGRNGTKAIMGLTGALDVQQKMMKTNVSEAARYQQALGGVSARARAAGKDIGEIQRTTKAIARNFTGDINSAQALVTDVLQAGEQREKNITKQAKVITQLGAATGGSGSGIAASLRQLSLSFGSDSSAENISNLGDALTSVTSKMGASADEVAAFSQQIAPFAKNVGLSQTSVLGFSTAFSKMGESGSRSARVFSTVLSDIDKSVRDGLPTLGKYAEAMGMTTDQLKELAKSDPTEMMIQFTESLAKGGDQAVRTMENLGLGSVVEQRALSNLASYGDLRGTIAEAQKGFASGSTAKSAAEQLEGLNEQMGRLQESLTQTVANSGQPFTKTMEGIAKTSNVAADALAGVTGSDFFQNAMMLGFAGTTAFKGLGAVAGGMYTATGAAGVAGMLPRERLSQAGAFIGDNRGKIMGLGAAGMLAGQMTGSPGMNTLGMGAFVAASMLGPGSMAGARRGWRFLTDDANAIARSRPSEMMSIIGDRNNAAALTAGREMSGIAGFRRGGQFGFSGRERVVEDYLKEMQKWGGLDKGEAKKIQRDLFGTFTKSGKLAMEGTVDKLVSDIKSGVKIDPGRLAMISGQAAEAGPQLAGQRAAGAGRAAAATTGNMLAGAGGLLMNPWVLGGAAVVGGAAVAGYAGYKEYQENRRTGENITSGTGLQDAQKFASAIGETVPQFVSLASEARNVEEAFSGVVSAIGAGAFKEGGKGLSSEQYAGLSGEGEATFEFTDVQQRRLGGRRKGRSDSEAVSELISKYGIVDSDKGQAAIAADLKKTGLTKDETNALMGEYAKAVTTPMKALSTGLESFAKEGGKGNSEETLSKVIANYVAESQENNVSGATIAKDLVDAISGSGMTESAKVGLLKQYSAEGGALEGRIDTDALEKAGRNAAMFGPNAPGYYGTGGTNEPAPAVSASGLMKTGAAAGETPLSRAAEIIGTQYKQPEGKRGVIGDWLSGAAGIQQAGEVGIVGGRQISAGEQESARKQMNTAGVTFANNFTEGFADELGKIEPGDVVKISGMGEAISTVITGQFGTGKGLQALRQESYRYGSETPQGMVYATAIAAAERKQESEYRGMSPFAQVQARQQSAQSQMRGAISGLKSGAVNQEQAQADFGSGLAALQSGPEQMENAMREYLTAYKSFQRSQTYAVEDYNRSVAYAEKDAYTQRTQAREQFQMSQKYATQDYHRSMLYMEQDFAKTQERAARDYQVQRVRSMEDHAVQLKRAAESAAKSMYDPFQRISLEQTWSGTGLAENLKQQQEMFTKQLGNLKGVRGAGLDQGVIDMLGLNDPNKAQQLDRLMQDIQGVGGGDIVKQLNDLAESRTKAGGQLFGKENDVGARQQEEDYNKALKRMGEDRQRWLKDSQSDYDTARKRAEKAFDTQMKRAREGFDVTMKYMEKAQKLALERMGTAHDTAMKRAKENFEATFETIGGDFETLAEETRKALAGKTPKWTEIVESGAESMKTAFNKGMTGVPEDFIAEMKRTIEAEWGKDSKVGAAFAAMLNALAAGVGTGGGGAAAPVTPGKDLSTSSDGPTNGKGNWSGNWRNYRNGGFHGGADIGIPKGTPVYSVLTGTVKDVRTLATTQTGTSGSYGRYVVLTDGNRDFYYAHLSEQSVAKGQKVRPGSMVGRSGNTGHTLPRGGGYHLHFEVRPAGAGHTRAISPGPWMRDGGIATTHMRPHIAEAGPEAVIPLNRTGAEFMAQMLASALSGSPLLRGTGMASAYMPATVTTISEDHSVHVHGEVKVVSNDPDRVMRELERAARARAIIQPSGRSGS